ncbi:MULTISPECIES: DUF6479 family protein [unclassified Streptomyces]|nr:MULTISPECIES: DUF6479 family protein [unclassified Streptomyces]MYR27018.1 hypothetical protein [Streptomyces sp. SID4945]SCD80271.1 hypothetical protein GA0115251_12453 [Streptomyces sp. TverLS-915]SCF16516.1 hypothetical protein GA0115257_10793 [Streptomyces sp. LcepLS]
MDTTQWNLAANSAAIIMPVIGVFVVAALIAAFAYGRRLRARQPAPPKPDEQPHLPEGGPIGEERELREPDEMEPREARLTPHELNGGGRGRTGAALRRRNASGTRTAAEGSAAAASAEPSRQR